MHIVAVIYLKRYHLNNVKQVLRKPITFLVTSYCWTITYDPVGFSDKSMRNHVQKCCVFSHRANAPHALCMSTPLVTQRPGSLRDHDDDDDDV